MLALGDPKAWPRSHVFQNTTIDTNEKKINLKEEKKNRLVRGKGRGSEGARDFNAPKDLRKTSVVISPQI